MAVEFPTNGSANTQNSTNGAGRANSRKFSNKIAQNKTRGNSAGIPSGKSRKTESAPNRTAPGNSGQASHRARSKQREHEHNPADNISSRQDTSTSQRRRSQRSNHTRSEHRSPEHPGPAQKKIGDKIKNPSASKVTGADIIDLAREQGKEDLLDFVDPAILSQPSVITGILQNTLGSDPEKIDIYDVILALLLNYSKIGSITAKYNTMFRALQIEAKYDKEVAAEKEIRFLEDTKNDRPETPGNTRSNDPSRMKNR